MQQFRILLLLIPFCSLSISNYGQKPIDFNHYKLDQTLQQHKAVFKFWVGSTDSTKKNLVIQKVENNSATIIFNHFMYNDMYDVVDRNNDGNVDVTIGYHDFDFIWFFDDSLNSFKSKPVYLPSTFGLVDSAWNIYWGYGDAQYSEKYDFSILYRIVGFTPIRYFKIVYITPEDHTERKEVTRIELYEFKNGDYGNPVFVKVINTKDPSKFNYEDFWKKNYIPLLSNYHAGMLHNK